MAEALRATALTKSFGTVNAVAGVSLTLEEGQCLAVLGPNGAGKTTLVEMLEGLITPDRGDVKILGLSYKAERAQIYETVGVLLQETHLYKRFTVCETLTLFASFFRRTTDLNQLMEDLGLTEKKDTRLHQLSGGQRQRVYLGCALVNDPKLLFLDEPTTGLDPQARRYTWDLLQKAKKNGRSILLTTHYMDEAEYLADHVVIIDKGTVLASGTPKGLILEVCGEQKLIFDFQTDLIAHTVKQELPSLVSAQVVGTTIEVSTASAIQIIANVTKYCEKNDITMTSLQMRENTLEDVFIKLTGRRLRET